jgi:inorganic pyrophosphatase
MSVRLEQLAPYDDEGSLQVVVECPRHSTIKLEFDAKLRAFTVSRELPLGVVYPFDWGFIPGTRGDDGDPLDAMVLHSHPSYPGVVLPCRVLGMLQLVQTKKKKRRAIVNNRIIATPSWHQALAPHNEAIDLPGEVREQIEQFFVHAVALTGKHVSVKGWASAEKTRRFVEASLA